MLHPTGKLRLRVPMGANAQAAAGSGAPSSVEEFSTSVLSDLCAEDSDGDSVVGYRSEGETAVILSPGAIEANPHHQMRRSANEPLVGLPIPEPEPESDKDLVDTGVLAATEANVLDEGAETGGRAKGKAPRASEVRKWLAGLIEGVSGMDRLATAALGATGHGGVSCRSARLFYNCLTDEVVHVSQLETLFGTIVAERLALEHSMAEAGNAVTSQELGQIKAHYEAQVRAIRSQVLHEQQASDRTIAQLRGKLARFENPTT